MMILLITTNLVCLLLQFLLMIAHLQHPLYIQLSAATITTTMPEVRPFPYESECDLSASLAS